jgi:hypothetical protein
MGEAYETITKVAGSITAFTHDPLYSAYREVMKSQALPREWHQNLPGQRPLATTVAVF